MKRWPVIIVAMLAANAAIVAATVKFARGDKSFAVEPDYYDKAVRWEDHQRQLAENTRLGWTVDVEPSPLIDPNGTRLVRVRVVDNAGGAVEHARVTIEAFHNARAARRSAGMLAESGDGWYSAPLPLPLGGLHTVRITAERAGDRFAVEIESEFDGPLPR